MSGKYCLNERAFVRVFGDYGGTDSTWQVYAGGGYYLNDCWHLSLDYRHFEQEYTKGRTTVDLEQKGPQMGLHYTF